jgi:hypothetical protein
VSVDGSLHILGEAGIGYLRIAKLFFVRLRQSDTVACPDPAAF